jgi:uncharacterized membrane protein
MGGATVTFGPMQMLVVEFTDGKFKGDILAELKRLTDEDIVRLVDMLVVRKEQDGELTVLQMSDLDKDEAREFGAVIGALIGLGADGEEGMSVGAVRGAEALEDGHVFHQDEVWYLADAIPMGGTAGVALLEHRWAIPLRDAIEEAGGAVLADEWVHPADLIAIGHAATHI